MDLRDIIWENIAVVDDEELNQDFPFQEDSGLTVRMPTDSNPLDFLQLYLTDEIYELIIRETNRFAKQFIDANPDKARNKYLKQWYDLTKEELRIFIGLALLMGIVHKPNLNLYWSGIICNANICTNYVP